MRLVLQSPKSPIGTLPAAQDPSLTGSTHRSPGLSPTSEPQAVKALIQPSHSARVRLGAESIEMPDALSAPIFPSRRSGAAPFHFLAT